MNPHAYNIAIQFGTFEGEQLDRATTREFPDLVTFAETANEAYKLYIDAIETTAEALSGSGKKLPAPIVPDTTYSGRVTLRLPVSLHRALALQAEAEGISLNQWLVTLLSHNGFEAEQIRSM